MILINWLHIVCNEKSIYTLPNKSNLFHKVSHSNQHILFRWVTCVSWKTALSFQLPSGTPSWQPLARLSSTGVWHSGISPITALRITFSQRSFTSSVSAVKQWTDLDWHRRKLVGGWSTDRWTSSTWYPRSGMVHWALTSWEQDPQRDQTHSRSILTFQSRTYKLLRLGCC